MDSIPWKSGESAIHFFARRGYKETPVEIWNDFDLTLFGKLTVGSLTIVFMYALVTIVIIVIAIFKPTLWCVRKFLRLFMRNV